MSAERGHLSKIRSQIDEIDTQLLELISRRARLAQKTAQIKQAESDKVIYYRSEREASIRQRVRTANTGPLPDDDIGRIFQEIMSSCRSLEQRLKVAHLGPRGTFTESATERHFGQAIDTIPLDTIDAVFREVESGESGYGVVPIENSSEGGVSHTLDMFIQSPLSICGEVELRIHQNLMSNERELNQIKKIYSHQQSLGQCRRWLERNLPSVETEAVESNAQAAKIAATKAGSAALGGKSAAAAYGLSILASGIEDEPNNTTRFLVIGGEPVPPTGWDKTSLLLSSKNEPGALFNLLEPLARYGVSMTRIESRPAGIGVWEYVFFVDVEGHAEEENVASAIKEIKQNALLLKVLGSFPRAVSR